MYLNFYDTSLLMAAILLPVNVLCTHDWLCMVDVPLTLRMHKKPNSLAWMQRHLSVLIHLWWLYVCACFVLSRNSVPFHSILSHFPRSWILWFYCLIYLPRIDIAKGEISNMISIDNERLFHSRLSQCGDGTFFPFIYFLSVALFYYLKMEMEAMGEREREKSDKKKLKCILLSYSFSNIFSRDSLWIKLIYDALIWWI